jgi:hypothetical protein
MGTALLVVQYTWILYGNVDTHEELYDLEFTEYVLFWKAWGTLAWVVRATASVQQVYPNVAKV